MNDAYKQKLIKLAEELHNCFEEPNFYLDESVQAWRKETLAKMAYLVGYILALKEIETK